MSRSDLQGDKFVKVNTLTPLQRGMEVYKSLCIMATALIGHAITNFDPALRHISGIPDALNIFEHTGNIYPSTPFAIGAYALASMSEKRLRPATTAITQRVVVAAGIGLAIGGLVNATTETEFGNDHIGKYGEGIIYDKSYPDEADLVWGAGSVSLIAGSLALARARTIINNNQIMNEQPGTSEDL